ncbi:Putative peptidase S1, PA clan [Colletotrichum destructivum]|uniref:Peptidase S1, PA clan n=1 Tax=Colletotrichum destructivum TaxID=34406 RepID=A0AAX4IGL8_9PEZI|nr:Putative peptidase S1, PA clan [Colletotrichum destructivum]
MDLTRRPTEHERDRFYNGLFSLPKLVARSSFTPFKYGWDDWSSPTKTLAVVDEHAIVSQWNDEPSPLRNQILGILAREKVNWQAIDIVRIGYVGEEMPVIVSISVLPDTLSWEMGNQVAFHCRNALVEHGLDDVHCEIKESMLVNLASSPAVLQQDSHQHRPFLRSYMYELADQLGTSIASLDQPYREGTKGIYLRRAGGEPDEVFALTCRHVCYDESETGCLLPREKSLPGKSVIQLSERTRKALVADLEDLKYQSVKVLRGEGKAEGESHDDKIITECQRNVNEISAVLQHFTLREALEARVLGDVAYASEYAVGSSGHLSDWCLIRLRADSHERRLSELSNRVYIDGRELESHFGALVLCIKDLDHDGTLHIQGIVAASEFQKPTRSCRIVGMSGRTSGVTFGEVNQVKSVVRRVAHDGTPLISREFGVVAERMQKYDHFAGKGDSGACVFDLKGRVVGMVSGGIKREEVLNEDHDYIHNLPADVTYFTPMESILADMEACGLSMEIV